MRLNVWSLLLLAALVVALPLQVMAKGEAEGKDAKPAAAAKALDPDKDLAHAIGGLKAEKLEALLKLLNEGKADELTELPGVGPATAKAIMAIRPLKKLQDLIKVKGMSHGKVLDIVVFASASEAVKAMKEKNRAALLDLLNKGSKEDLQVLPGIGESMADKIIEARPYHCVDHLTRVSGISDGKLVDIVKFADAGKKTK